MLRDIVQAKPLENWQLELLFEDGVSGIVDVAKLIDFEGVFAPLRDVAEFRRVVVNAELVTVVWPSGADLDPDVLYAVVTASASPDFPAPNKRDSAPSV